MSTRSPVSSATRSALGATVWGTSKRGMFVVPTRQARSSPSRLSATTAALRPTANWVACRYSMARLWSSRSSSAAASSVGSSVSPATACAGSL